MDLRTYLFGAWTLLGVFIGMAGGCIDAPAEGSICAIVEQPAANIPGPLRWQNWTNSRRQGSCCIASTCSMEEWAGQHELAQFLRKTYAGPQTQISIQQKLTAARVPFICTEYADVRLLEYATRTRRNAIVWYYDRHCVTFCGFGTNEGKQVAWLLDNNKVGQFIPVPKQEFLYFWKHQFGGFGLVSLHSPAPPLPQ